MQARARREISFWFANSKRFKIQCSADVSFNSVRKDGNDIL